MVLDYSTQNPFPTDIDFLQEITGKTISGENWDKYDLRAEVVA